MKFLIYSLMAIFLFGVNLGLLGIFSFFDAVPNLLLIFIVVLASDKFAGKEFFPIAIFSGLILDSYSPNIFGSFAFAFFLIAFFVNLFCRKFVILERNWKYLAGLLFFSQSFLYLFVFGYIEVGNLFHWQGNGGDFKISILHFFGEYVYSAILLSPVLILSDFMKFWHEKYFIKAKVY